MATSRARRYGAAALAGLLGELASAPEGQRNEALFRVSRRARDLVDEGKLEPEPTSQALEAGGLCLGLKAAEVQATVRSGLQAGTGRALPPAPSSCTEAGHGSERKQDALLSHSCRPPIDEVKALWEQARPVGDDVEVAKFLESRNITPDKVELSDLARAIPAGARVPRWAGCRFQGGWLPWSRHHRLVVRGWGAMGTMESLHARALGHLPQDLPKGLWPAAGAGSASGLLMAEPLALLLLQGQAPSWWKRKEVVIAEGLPDFLSWATNYSEADANAPAIFGITAGSWSPALAGRIPDDCRVIVATHHDPAGDRYAATIAETFAERNCELRRWTQE